MDGFVQFWHVNVRVIFHPNFFIYKDAISYHGARV